MPRPLGTSTLVVILGGGRGTRLFPLTRDRAKPAVPFGGKYRLIDIPMSNCIHWGFKHIFVLTQYKSASLNNHMSQTYVFDMFTRGFVHILAASEGARAFEWYRGTADAVRRNLRHFQSFDFRDFLILSGDQLYRMNLRALVEFHREHSADVTIACRYVPLEQASSLGIAFINDDYKLIKFYEKPSPDTLKTLLAPSTHEILASMGIYVFRKEVLYEVLENEDYQDFGKDIIPNILSHARVYVYPFRGYWEDIGTIHSFFHAHMKMLEEQSPFSLMDPNYPIYTHPRFLPPSSVTESTIVQSSLSEGCFIKGATIRQCFIGIRSRIASGSQLECVLVMGFDYYPGSFDDEWGIGQDSMIRYAIIDKNVNIGRCVKLINKKGFHHYDHELFHVRDGIIVVPKNTTIPDGFEF